MSKHIFISFFSVGFVKSFRSNAYLYLIKYKCLGSTVLEDFSQMFSLISSSLIIQGFILDAWYSIQGKCFIINSVPELYEIAFLNERPSDPHTKNSFVAENGALCAYSGLKTGR